MQKYRMYIDEVGNSDLNASENSNHRYLSLTGVIKENFSTKIIELLCERKYDRSPDGKIDGWGIKWLP